MGTQFQDEFVTHQPEYVAADAAAKVVMKTEANGQFMAYLLIRGSDQTRYGSLLKGFVSQFSLGNDQYPKTIMTATDVLSNHKIDPSYYDNQKKSRDRSRTHNYSKTSFLSLSDPFSWNPS